MLTGEKTVNMGELLALSLPDVSNMSRSGYSLQRRMRQGLESAVEHQIAFEMLDEGLREVRSEDVDGWRTMLVDWEEDRSKENPYESSTAGEASSLGMDVNT
jgi:hypothetical protein